MGHAYLFVIQVVVLRWFVSCRTYKSVNLDVCNRVDTIMVESDLQISLEMSRAESRSKTVYSTELREG